MNTILRLALPLIVGLYCVCARANTAPVFIGGDGSYAVAENAPLNHSIGFVAAEDADQDSLAFSLATPSSLVDVDEVSGELRLIAALDRSVGVNFEVVVRVSDGALNVDSTQTVFIIPAAQANLNGITLDRWLNIGGSTISSLTNSTRYPVAPSETSVLGIFETTDQPFGNYAQRLSGFLRVIQTGDYRVWIASDDQSQIRLSSDATQVNLGSVLANVPSHTGVRAWTKYSSQRSDVIRLVAGRLYAVEVLHKEGGGGDHVAVALQPEGSDEAISGFIIDASQSLPKSVVDAELPVQISALSADLISSEKVNLTWAKTSDNNGVEHYVVTRDGIELAQVGAGVSNYSDITVNADTVYNYGVVAFDAFGNRSVPATLVVDTANLKNAVELAIESGDARLVGEPIALVEAAIDTIEQTRDSGVSLKAQLFNLNSDGSAKADGSSLTSVSWDPTHDAALLGNFDPQNTTVLLSNDVTNTSRPILSRSFGIAGEIGTSRYLALGSNPFRGNGYNDQFNQFMLNSLEWLTQRSDLNTAPFNVVLAQLGQSFYFPDETKTRAWLDDQFAGKVSYNSADACNGEMLAVCLNNSPDLLIISQVEGGENVAEIKRAVKDAMDAGVPVLYMHFDGGITDLGRQIFELMRVNYVADNRFINLKLTEFDVTETLMNLSGDLSSLLIMLKHFRDGDYALDWSQCDGENCSAVPNLQADFLDAANIVRNLVRNYDSAKTNIFEEQGLRLQKLLVLIGDRFRQDAIYPMDKVATPDDEFLRAYYADYATYNARGLNPAMPNMGNFSRSDFSHITPTSRVVNTISKRNFKATGAYALPGQTFSVTRNDDSDVRVRVFVNTIRNGATHQYANYGYNRPKYLQSAYVEVKPGEAIELTNAYGGPIQLEFNQNDFPISVTMDNIGEHAYWESPSDDASFTEKLEANEFDWAELVTPGFQVHSKLDRMVRTVTDPKWGSAVAAAAATTRYMHNFSHALAGFQGPGIDVVDEIHDVANEKGWAINSLDIVKHMNADQATCGGGCSGNPYDAYWTFDPIAHGDIHELGHGLQGGLRFIGWENHSMTNHYSYYAKSIYAKDTNTASSCQSLPFERNFNLLQESIKQANPVEYLQQNLWEDSAWNDQAASYIQMLMSAQYAGVIENGWHIRALLHIIEREFNRADNSDLLWEEKRESLGFSNYTRTEARGVNADDKLLIFFSVVTGRDYIDYLEMWGRVFSDKAKTQVASLNLPAIERVYFMTSANGFCEAKSNGDFLAKVPVPVDGEQVWPSQADDDEDGLWSVYDNCPLTENFDQNNNDLDGQGDACDLDDDNDESQDSDDNCQFISNPDQLDTDNDLFGDACDSDKDDDTVLNADDNCPLVANPDQADRDENEVGDACQIDEELCFPVKARNNAVSMVCL